MQTQYKYIQTQIQTDKHRNKHTKQTQKIQVERQIQNVKVKKSYQSTTYKEDLTMVSQILTSWIKWTSSITLPQQCENKQMSLNPIVRYTPTEKSPICCQYTNSLCCLMLCIRGQLIHRQQKKQKNQQHCIYIHFKTKYVLDVSISIETT